MQFPVNAKEIIPHRDQMLLLDSLEFSSPDLMRGRAVIRPENLFLGSSGLEGACLVELLAQLAAAGDGYEAITSGKPVRSGFLVGVNDFTIMKTASAGDTLELNLRKGMQLNNYTVAEGDIWRGGDHIAQGSLKLFVMDSGLPERPGEARSSASQALGNAMSAESAVRQYLRRNSSRLKSGEGTVRGSIVFKEDFPAFQGHFPGYPIVPGVVLLHLALIMAEEEAGGELALAGVDRAKFSKQVLPNDPVLVDLTVTRESDFVGVKAALSIEGKPAASLAIRARKR